MTDTKKLRLVLSKNAIRVFDLLELAAKQLDPMLKVPLLGKYVKDLQDMISMFRDYGTRKYTKLPFSAFIGGAVILSYLVLPFDLIPDNIPVLGFIDDAFVIGSVIDLCLDAELDRYRKWRDEQKTVSSC